MSAARKLISWEEPETQRVGLQGSPAANDNALKVCDVGRETEFLSLSSQQIHSVV